MRVAVVLLLSMLLFVLSSGVASSNVLYVPDTYDTIQAAVDNASNGDTIIIKNGTYLENVVVNKSITITSESGPSYTTVNASDEGMHVFNIISNGVNITKLTIGRARDIGTKAGVYLGGRQNCTISDNVIIRNARGIYATGGGHNNISNNRIESNGGIGLYMYHSSHNTIANNTGGSNSMGIYLYYYCEYNTLHSNTVQSNDYEGIYLSHFSNHNYITNNTVSNNGGEGGMYLYLSDYNTIANNSISNVACDIKGVFLYKSDYNVLTGNNISCNQVGIYLFSGCDYNLVYNNYLHNRLHNALASGTNSWNTTKTPGRNILGGPYLGGNYWSDYNGTDTDGDGLGDTPYTVAGLNIDYHPLTEPAAPSPPVVLFHTLHEVNNVRVPVEFISDSYDPDGRIVSWSWGFGDGTTGEGEAPNHTYTAYMWDVNKGTYFPYSVRLTVTDNSGANNTTTRAVMVYMAADANGDGIVDILDASLVGLHWNARYNSTNYHDGADLNNDNVVNILDAALVGLNWNTRA